MCEAEGVGENLGSLLLGSASSEKISIAFHAIGAGSSAESRRIYVIGDHVFPRGTIPMVCGRAHLFVWPDTLFIDVPPTAGNFVCETKWLRGICHRSFMTHRAEPVRPIVTTRRGAIATFHEFVVDPRYVWASPSSRITDPDPTETRQGTREKFEEVRKNATRKIDVDSCFDQ